MYYIKLLSFLKSVYSWLIGIILPIFLPLAPFLLLALSLPILDMLTAIHAVRIKEKELKIREEGGEVIPAEIKMEMRFSSLKIMNTVHKIREYLMVLFIAYITDIIIVLPMMNKFVEEVGSFDFISKLDTPATGITIVIIIFREFKSFDENFALARGWSFIESFQFLVEKFKQWK